MCFVFIWEQTATCATYSINWLVFITETKSVYCAVRTGSLNKAVCALSLEGLKYTTTTSLDIVWNSLSPSRSVNKIMKNCKGSLVTNTKTPNLNSHSYVAKVPISAEWNTVALGRYPPSATASHPRTRQCSDTNITLQTSNKPQYLNRNVATNSCVQKCETKSPYRDTQLWSSDIASGLTHNRVIISQGCCTPLQVPEPQYTLITRRLVADVHIHSRIGCTYKMFTITNLYRAVIRQDITYGDAHTELHNFNPKQ